MAINQQMFDALVEIGRKDGWLHSPSDIDIQASRATSKSVVVSDSSGRVLRRVPLNYVTKFINAMAPKPRVSINSAQEELERSSKRAAINGKRFKNPANGYTEEVSDMAMLWVLLFGGFYFAYKGIWGHFIVGILLALPTCGISWLIYPLFAPEIVRRNYLRKGWVVVDE